jgi:hypothetical protein
MARPKRDDKEKDVQDKWEERIKKAKKFREEDFENNFQTKLGLSYYEGNQKPDGVIANEWITVNKIFSHLRTQLPLLYSVDPYFYIKLKRTKSLDPIQIASQEAKAEKRQAMINYLKVELNLKQKARLGVQDAHFEYGVMKTHYTAELVENPDKGKPIMSESDGEDDESIPLFGDDGVQLIEPDEIPINERYVIQRVRACDFLFSEDAGTLQDKWHWVAEKIVLTKEEAKKNHWIDNSALKDAPTFQKEDKKNEDGKISSSFSKTKVENVKDKEQDVYVGWEIYDLDNKEWLMIGHALFNTQVRVT